MPIEDLFIHDVDLFREQEYRKDRFGQPLPGEPWQSYACRLTAAKGGEVFKESSRDVIRAQHELFLPAGADVQESDEATVRDESGKVLVERGNVVLVRTAYDRWGAPHHVEAFIDTRREPRSGKRG